MSEYMDRLRAAQKQIDERDRRADIIENAVLVCLGVGVLIAALLRLW